jgi:hypothetical protein
MDWSRLRLRFRICLGLGLLLPNALGATCPEGLGLIGKLARGAVRLTGHSAEAMVYPVSYVGKVTHAALKKDESFHVFKSPIEIAFKDKLKIGGFLVGHTLLANYLYTHLLFQYPEAEKKDYDKFTGLDDIDCSDGKSIAIVNAFPLYTFDALNLIAYAKQKELEAKGCKVDFLTGKDFPQLLEALQKAPKNHYAQLLWFGHGTTGDFYVEDNQYDAADLAKIPALSIMRPNAKLTFVACLMGRDLRYTKPGSRLIDEFGRVFLSKGHGEIHMPTVILVSRLDEMRKAWTDLGGTDDEPPSVRVEGDPRVTKTMADLMRAQVQRWIQHRPVRELKYLEERLFDESGQPNFIRKKF